MIETIAKNAGELRRHEKKMLVKLPNYAGDIIMCFPALQLLRDSFADHEIYLLTEDSLSDLLHGQNFYHKPVSPTWNAHDVSPLRISRYLRSMGKFHIAICLTRQLRFTLAFLLARIPNRVGCKRFPANIGLNRPVPDPEKDTDFVGRRYYIELINRILEEFSLTRFSKVSALPLRVDQQRRDEVEKLLGEDWKNDFYVIVSGSSSSVYGLLKRWPLENYVKLAGRLFLEKPELRPLFLFGPGEESLYERIEGVYKNALPPKTIAVKPGAIRIGHVMSIVEKSKFVVANDTGPRHIAMALSKKVITIFGPTNIARATYPAHLECPVWVNVGCNLRECKAGTRLCKENRICMTSITPGLVCEKIMKFVYQKTKKRE